MPFFGGDRLELAPSGDKRSLPLSESDALHWERLKRVQTHTQTARRYFPNFSKRYYGALVVLENGIEGMGVNVEPTHQTAFCDLRYAITNAVNQSIAAKTGQKSLGTVQTPKVKTIYLVNSELQKDAAPIPCSDCQEWLTSRYCSPDTQLISLEQAPHGKEMIRFRTVKEMLPQHSKQSAVRFWTERPVSALPISISEEAQLLWQSLGRGKKAENQVRNLVMLAKQAFLEQPEPKKEKSREKQAGAAVLLGPSGIIERAARLEWGSTRWFEPTDLRAVSVALNELHKQQFWIRKLPGFLQRFWQSRLQPQSIQAVAYYGNDAYLPPVASLGRLSRFNGSKEVLLVTVENDRIQVRTSKDFMTEMYRAGA